MFTELLPSNDRRYTDTHTHRLPTNFLLLRAFIVTENSLPSRLLIMKGVMHFTQPLPSNKRRDTLMRGIYEVVHRWGELRCHDLETKFHQDWFRRSKDNGGRRNHRLKSTFFFFRNEESGLKFEIFHSGIDFLSSNHYPVTLVNLSYPTKFFCFTII